MRVLIFYIYIGTQVHWDTSRSPRDYNDLSYIDPILLVFISSSLRHLWIVLGMRRARCAVLEMANTHPRVSTMASSGVPRT